MPPRTRASVSRSSDDAECSADSEPFTRVRTVKNLTVTKKKLQEVTEEISGDITPAHADAFVTCAEEFHEFYVELLRSHSTSAVNRNLGVLFERDERTMREAFAGIASALDEFHRRAARANPTMLIGIFRGYMSVTRDLFDCVFCNILSRDAKVTREALPRNYGPGTFAACVVKYRADLLALIPREPSRLQVAVTETARTAGLGAMAVFSVLFLGMRNMLLMYVGMIWRDLWASLGYSPQTLTTHAVKTVVENGAKIIQAINPRLGLNKGIAMVSLGTKELNAQMLLKTNMIRANTANSLKMLSPNVVASQLTNVAEGAARIASALTSPSSAQRLGYWTLFYVLMAITLLAPLGQTFAWHVLRLILRLLKALACDLGSSVYPLMRMVIPKKKLPERLGFVREYDAFLKRLGH